MGITHIDRISFRLETQETDHFDTLKQFTVSFDTDIDLGGIIVPAEQQTIGRCESGGVTMEIFGYSVDDDGSLILDVSLDNRSGNSLPLGPSYTAWNCLVNGCRPDRSPSFRSNASNSSAVSEISDGTRWYGKLKIPSGNQDPFLSVTPLDQDDFFRAFDIRFVESIHLMHDNVSLEIAFNEPLDYAGLRGWNGSSYPSYPVAVDTEYALVRVESVRRINDRIGIVLQWENRTDTDILIFRFSTYEYYNALINQSRMSVWFSTEDMYRIVPGESRRCLVYIFPEGSGQWSDWPVTSLEFPLVGGTYSGGATGPTVHIDLNTPLQSPGDIVDDLIVR